MITADIFEQAVGIRTTTSCLRVSIHGEPIVFEPLRDMFPSRRKILENYLSERDELMLRAAKRYKNDWIYGQL